MAEEDILSSSITIVDKGGMALIKGRVEYRGVVKIIKIDNIVHDIL